MLKLISTIILVFLFATVSYAQTQFDQDYENLSQDEKKIVDAVLDNFLKGHIIFLSELSQANKLMGAAAISDIETVTDEKLDERHFNLPLDVHKKEHLAVKVLPIKRGADGKYHTPVQVLGDNAYSYKIIHTVEIQGKDIKISRSKLSDTYDSRIETPPNQWLIKNIAEHLKGTVSNNTIKLL